MKYLFLMIMLFTSSMIANPLNNANYIKIKNVEEDISVDNMEVQAKIVNVKNYNICPLIINHFYFTIDGGKVLENQKYFLSSLQPLYIFLY